MADKRIRLTERGYNPKNGSFAKSADPYLMNQERRPGSNPSATRYESGNPSTWGEDVTPIDTWKKEYEAGRNESNIGNFLPNTFVHRNPEEKSYDKASYDKASTVLREAAMDRQAAFEAARKTAHKALHLAHALFPKANEQWLQDQARDFMAMGPAALNSTLSRIIDAKKEKEKEDEEEEVELEEVEVEEAEEAEAEEAEEEVEEKESKKKASIASYERELDVIKKASDAHLYKGVISSLEKQISKLKKTEGRLATLKNNLHIAGEEKEEKEEKEEEKESSEYDIELISSELDSLPNDGDMLDTIFASEKTSSTDKGGKKGVRSIGGVGKVASDNGVNDLSALWKSDPDVSGEFR